MIRAPEELSFSPGPRAAHRPRRAPPRATDHNAAVEWLHRFAAPIPTQEPTDWGVANVVFADTEVQGPFRIAGREYLRDIINDADDNDTREKTFIAATGVGKTLAIMVRHLWTIVHHPRRALMAMPATKGAGGSETYVTSRFIPALEATLATADLMPEGQRRLFMNSKKVRLNGCHFDFVGGKSSSQIASNRCSLIELDELDKMSGRLGNEAGTKQLIGERTEGVIDYQIFQSTTPTIEDGQGWKCLMRSDFRRRFLPCPKCNAELVGRASPRAVNLKGWFDLAWSEQYSILPLKLHTGEAIPRAYLTWDKEATRKDGTFDKDRIVRSARFECPHCRHHIRDEDKLWMDQHGVWLPTRESHGHKGYHLSALYAPPLVSRDADPTHKSLLGGRALKFIDALEEGQGMKNFINSTLAEVDISQEHGRGEIQLTSRPIAQSDWIPLMTVDVQKLWPYLWFVIRKWSTFKLEPPFELTNGRPAFSATLGEPLKTKCAELLAGSSPANETATWNVIAELLRFDSQVGEYPLLDWLIAQHVTGPDLVALYRTRCCANTIDLGKHIYRELGQTMPRGGDSEAIAVGHCQTDDWAELRELAVQYDVGKHLANPHAAILIDSGYREKNNPEVLRKCYETATDFGYYDAATKKLWTMQKHRLQKPCPLNNWQPWKGYPINRRWNVNGVAAEWHYNYADPFAGTSEADQCVIQVLEGASDLFWERMDRLRSGNTKNRWAISGSIGLFPKEKFTLSQYERQLNARYQDHATGEIKSRGGGGGAGHRHWPDELNDCEKMQVALAESLGFFSYDPTENQTQGENQ